MKKWEKGDKGEQVREIVDHNFSIVNNHLLKTCYFVTTAERLSDDLDYLKENGVFVYDTDKNQFFRRINGLWIVQTIGAVYSEMFDESQWLDGEIFISHQAHCVSSPVVQVLILNGDGIYEEVIGGYYINNDNDVILQSDINFSGKVVIK